MGRLAGSTRRSHTGLNRIQAVELEVAGGVDQARLYWPGGPQAAWPEGGWLGQPGRLAKRQAGSTRLVLLLVQPVRIA